MNCFVIATGAALPARVVDNHELGAALGVEPEWIAARSGIHERRWVGADESASGLAAAAVERALEAARMDAGELDYLIACTLSPDYQVPGIGPLVQRRLAGCGRVAAVDLRVGCAGILYGLQLARALVASGAARRVACVGAEAQSKGLAIGPAFAELSMLFGDGAGALIVAAEPASGAISLRIDDVSIATDGRFAEDLCVRAPGTGNGARWLDEAQLAAGLTLGSFDGRSLVLHAVRKLADAAREVVERNGVALDEIDLVVPHQANGNLLATLASRLGIPAARVVSNVARFGNTSGASAFIALDDAWRGGRVRPGARVLVAAFGAGYTWGAALCRACGRSAP